MRNVPIIASLLFASTAMFGTTTTMIRSLRIVGDYSLPQHQLIGELHSHLAEAFSMQVLSDDVDRLVHLFQERGFYFAEIHVAQLSFTNDSSGVEIDLNVMEGKNVTIAAIILKGNEVVSSQSILGEFETGIGQVLLSQTLERDMDQLVSRYEHIGYPFASVDIEDVALSTATTQGDQIDVFLSVHEGEKVTIGEITIEGNSGTKGDVIARETHLKLPALYDAEIVDKIPQRLNRLNIFNAVDLPEVYTSPRGGGLLIRVQEGRTNTFDGILGYVPARAGGEEGSLIGFVNVSMRNLFGTARKLSVRWQKEERRTQEVAFRYMEPWVIGLPIDASIGFLQREQDTMYVRRVIDANASVSLFSDVSLGGIFEQEEIIPSSEIISRVVSSSRTTTAGVDVRYDSRDDPVCPGRGVEYRALYQIGRKRIYGSPVGGGPEDQVSTVQKIGFDATFYGQVIDRQVVMVGFHGRQITSDHIEVSDEFRLGGTNTLRGYRENQFVGSRIAWTNTEYRFLLSRRSFIFGLFDTGYYLLPGDDVRGLSSEQHVKIGYGFGMRVETALGNIGLSIALGQRDPVSQAKLHVSLVNEF